MGPRPSTTCRCPSAGESKRSILETYTKEYSAEYQAQALIDLARRLGPRIGDLSRSPRSRFTRATTRTT